MLYLFAGEARKTSVASFLKEKAQQAGFHIEVEEVDIMRREEDDLSLQSKQEEILRRIRSGEFVAVICTPPCSTWSRVRAANMRGPPPIRDRNYPWGYPWVKKKFEEELKLGNILVIFTIKVVQTVKEVGNVFILVEHPEDLGTVVREEDRAVLRPASIWQLDEMRRLIGQDVATVAINQCCWGARWKKPTRLLTNSEEIKKWGPQGWPQFDEEGFYRGPLKQDCGCKVTVSLAKKSNEEAFRTSGTSIYPAELDRAIAEAIIKFGLVTCASPPKVGEKRTGSSDQTGEQEEKEERYKRKRTEEVDGNDKTGKERSEVRDYLDKTDPGNEKEEEKKESREAETESQRRPGHGKPMQCFYKGKHRTIHDGGGLCSPGRWPVNQRRPLSSREGKELSAVVKSQFLKWLLKKGEGEVKDAFWKLVSGKHPSSPFEEIMEESRSKVDECLRAMGKDPHRRKRNRDSEIAFKGWRLRQKHAETRTPRG